MVTLLTRIVSYLAPHIATGLESLLSCLSRETRLAYGVVDGQLE